MNIPLFQITQQADELQKASAGLQRIAELFQIKRKHPVANPSELVTQPVLEGAPYVKLENVSFAYSAEETVLENISFEVQPRQIVGLIGRTSSGKSTIARLLLRLYEPMVGNITFNNIDIKSIHLNALREQIGIVTQNVELFHATVRDNLSLFNTTISDHKILAAFEELGLLDWYKTLPIGLDTRLDHNALSAGEAQLVAFVRLFLKDPNLIILDEASSRLDPDTERQLESVLDKLLVNRTVIMIAHRLTTLQRADKIIILNKGKIVESGDRIQLAADPDSYYYGLLRTGLSLLDAAERVLS